MSCVSVARGSGVGIAAALVVASALALVTPGGAVSARTAAGAIEGIVTTKEAAPRPIRVTIDADTCGDTLPDESITVDIAGRLANVVVTVVGVKVPSPAEAPVSNQKCAFAPRVSLMRPKGAVKMMSRDPMIHTMHAADPGGKALFNVSLPIPNLVASRPVEKPGVVTLSCSTHTWMRGYLFVTDEVSAISRPDGRFRLEGVPAGVHELRVWHETLSTAPVRVTVRDAETSTVNLTLAK